jgi:hypothetical protein
MIIDKNSVEGHLCRRNLEHVGSGAINARNWDTSSLTAHCPEIKEVAMIRGHGRQVKYFDP